MRKQNNSPIFTLADAREESLYEARRAALDRLQGSRNPEIRAFALDLVNVEDSEEHYRWIRKARMSEIVEWGSFIIAGVRENCASCKKVEQ